MSETEVRRRETTFGSHVYYCSITKKISRYGRISSISDRYFFYCPALFNRQKKRRLYYVELMTNISDAVDRSHLVPNIRNASSAQSIYDEGDNHRRGGVI